MPRLFFHVEGQTEENFVDIVLSEHLRGAGYISVVSRRLGLSNQRGGIRSWQSARKDILRHLKQQPEAIHATMVDYYGLKRDWPGRAEAPKINSTSGKGEYVEAALVADISRELGQRFDARRFSPLIMMHEFEALLFSDPGRFAQEIGGADLAAELDSIRQAFSSPEDIDDSPENAPSKRIARLRPGYNKVLSGVDAALGIGLATIRRECPHFNDWLGHLEALPGLFPS
jgi:hypothetical protein